MEEIDHAKVLLSESFRKQDEKDFAQAYLKYFISKMINMLKPEYVEEVTVVMEDFTTYIRE